EGAMMTGATIQCLAAIAKYDPAGVSKVIMTMLEGLARARDATVAQANIQVARVSLEVAVATCHLPSMKEAVRQVLLAACAAADSNVRSLAVVAVFRLERINYPLTLGVLQELARR